MTQIPIISPVGSHFLSGHHIVFTRSFIAVACSGLPCSVPRKKVDVFPPFLQKKMLYDALPSTAFDIGAQRGGGGKHNAWTRSSTT